MGISALGIRANATKLQSQTGPPRKALDGMFLLCSPGEMVKWWNGRAVIQNRAAMRSLTPNFERVSHGYSPMNSAATWTIKTGGVWAVLSTFLSDFSRRLKHAADVEAATIAQQHRPT